ncbi:MAG: MFS transporter [Oceanicaulis sp.]
MTPYASLSAAGFAATAITYGPARMGFGLYLNTFRDEFAISAGTAGAISAAGFAGFLAALPIAYAVSARRSPRAPVVLGLGLAAAGMGMIALAQGPMLLAGGAVLAMTSAGLAWTPFNLAVSRRIEARRRPEVLSIVSTGTAVGILVAALSALAAGSDGAWRFAWAGFAGAGALAAAGAALGMRPSGPKRSAMAGAARRLWSRRAAPLYALAFVFGAASTVYISFAADAVERAGVDALAPGAAASALFAVFGIAGLAGLVTAPAARRLGLGLLLRLLFLACAGSFTLIAAAPEHLPAVLVSAALQGVFVMMISAAFAFWSERLFPALPAMSFTAALLGVAAGSVAGPPAAGYAADAAGFAAVFAVAAIAATLTAVLTPQRPAGA